MDDMEDVELTPALLKFYRSKVHELQREQTAKQLARLKDVEMTSQQRLKMEKDLLEHEDELDQAEQDLSTLREALIRERRAVIELVEENAQLRAHADEESSDFPSTESSHLSSMKKHYQNLLSSIKADHKEQLARIRQQRHALADHLEGVISRCARLEVSVKESTKELLRERAEKQTLQIRVEEMQTSIEQKIRELRKRIDESDHGTAHAEIIKLRTENEELRVNVDDLKERLAVQSSQAQEKISRLQLELYRHKSQDHELYLEQNSTFREKIKQIERLALRYAPLAGPDVDYLFSEIDYAKDVIDGNIPPPKVKRSKSKKKSKKELH